MSYLEGSNASNDKSYRPLILLVDHDKDSLNEAIDALNRLKRTKSTMETLGELFRFEPVVIKPKNFTADRVYEVIKNYQNPDLILIDLSFGEHEDPDGVFRGRGVAAHLARKYRRLGFGVYTRYSLTRYQRAAISSDRFAVVFEDIGNSYGGPHRMGGDEWYNLLDKIVKDIRLQRKILPQALTETYGRGVAKWAEGHPHHRSFSFTRAACNLVDLALEWLDPLPTEIVITQLGGGFSGSFLVKADVPNRPKSYIVKIDEDPARLGRELEGYRIVQTLLNHRYYLPLLGLGKELPIRLAQNWWGAFAMEYEGEARPLIEHSGLKGESLADVYRRVWSQCLCDLYGTVSAEGTSVSNIVTNETVSSANDGWIAMKRYHNWNCTLKKKQRLVIDQFTSLLTGSLDMAFTSDKTLEMPCAERVHGDLNCRNILYDADKDTFCLIDFPSVGPPNCLARDFVKAEAELILIMMEWATGHDHDLTRVGVWDKLIEAVTSNFEPFDTVLADSESNRMLRVLRAIRETYDNMHQGKGQPRLTYQVYLFATLLSYFGYSDITIAKKLLAALWAGRLAKARWSE
jgi:hypothetical protein